MQLVNGRLIKDGEECFNEIGKALTFIVAMFSYGRQKLFSTSLNYVTYICNGVESTKNHNHVFYKRL
jgi:hypothetical protein